MLAQRIRVVAKIALNLKQSLLRRRPCNTAAFGFAKKSPKSMLTECCDCSIFSSQPPHQLAGRLGGKYL
jgi:hypothetical protein